MHKTQNALVHWECSVYAMIVIVPILRAPRIAEIEFALHSVSGGS
jgi:hypothetical protein